MEARKVSTKTNYVSIGEFRKRLGIKRLKSNIKISKKEEKTISEFRTKEKARANQSA